MARAAGSGTGWATSARRDEYDGGSGSCGRKSHRVSASTPAGTLFTIPCPRGSSTPTRTSRGRRWSASAIPGRARPVLCVELAAGRTTLRAVSSEFWEDPFAPSCWLIGPVRTHISDKQVDRCSCSTRSFPVDIRHNAKIFREKLAIWAARRQLAMNALVTGGGRLPRRGDRPTDCSIVATRSGAWPGAITRSFYALGVEVLRGDVADRVGRSQGRRRGATSSSTSRRRRGSGARMRRVPRPTSTGTRNVVEACLARHGVGRLVFTSSPSVVHAGRRHRRGRRVDPLSRPLRRRLPRDQGRGRAAGPGREW